MRLQTIVGGQTVDPMKVQRAKELWRRMTPEESMLWTALRTNKLHGFHFRRQQVIAGFIVNFYCHAAGLVVEVDGAIHRGQQEYDAERDQVLASHGLRILRIPNDDIRRNLAGALARIADACRATSATDTTT